MNKFELALKGATVASTVIGSAVEMMADGKGTVGECEGMIFHVARKAAGASGIADKVLVETGGVTPKDVEDICKQLLDELMEALKDGKITVIEFINCLQSFAEILVEHLGLEDKVLVGDDS